jgi:hypothetical protein
MNLVTIALQNLIVNQKDVAQNVSGLFFKLSTGQSSGSVVSDSGTERTVAGDGTFTNGGSASSGWGLSYVSGSGSATGFHLDGLNGSSTPAHTLLGAPDGSNVYSNANKSIAGNGPHNPFLSGILTLQLAIAGVTSSSNISQVTLGFGTTSGDNVPLIAQQTGVPEPGTMTLAAVGLAAVGLARLRSMRRKSSASKA